MIKFIRWFLLWLEETNAQPKELSWLEVKETSYKDLSVNTITDEQFSTQFFIKAMMGR